MCVFVFFFFKQKTAYEMRISDWSSDVCSSDLLSEETLKRMQEKGVFLVPTFMALDWVKQNADDYPPNIDEKARVAAAAHHARFRAGIRLGVKRARGTGETIRPDGHGRKALASGTLVDAVMSPTAAFVAGTINDRRLREQGKRWVGDVWLRT